jgi:tight adherence protein C
LTVALLAGIAVGTGIWLAWTGARPAPEPLAAALARVSRLPATAPAPPEGLDARDARIGRFLIRHLPPLARRLEGVRADLRVVGRAPEEQAVRVTAYIVLPLLLGPWVGLVGLVIGLPPPPALLGGVSLAASATGLVLPFASLRSEATQRRATFTHALSSWCDVLVMTLASGRGVEQALETAGRSGEGWAFAELRGALRAAYVRREPPWIGLGRLGRDLGVADLSELANTVSLAGEEGAAVRDTVAAKARTIRQRMSAESEMAAAATTEHMSLPTVLLVVGFLVFLCYPAIVAMFSITR